MLLLPISNRVRAAALLGCAAAGFANASPEPPPPSALIPPPAFSTGVSIGAPVANSAFSPAADALPAPQFAGVLKIAQCRMRTRPALEHALQHGRDARLFPGVALQFFTMDGLLVPVQRGEMVRETAPGKAPSYWRVIPQFGRVWRERADGPWSRAAFPLMLVNDTENSAHQGLATFLYRDGAVSGLRFQFVQQSAPYLLKQHFIAWGIAPMRFASADNEDKERLAALRTAAAAELARRLPAKPWTELLRTAAPGTLEGFGGPLYPRWIVAAALVKDGILYYQESKTPYGPYPYPLEMRFGVRSVMKSVGAPLALLRLAQLYGPWVLAVKIGDYVPGLDPKWRRVRLIDAADMASGFGGTGSLRTNPNDPFDGYLGGHYDDWYTAPSLADKISQINLHLHPYPWAPGTVMRYRDQDFFLLGAALDALLKSIRGPDADIWSMLRTEVFEPIGIDHAPAVRTREPGGREGLVWFNAGYYPTLDDLAKIAMLYHDLGAHDGHQLLNRQLTSELLSARRARLWSGDASVDPPSPGASACTAGDAGAASNVSAEERCVRYEMGFRFLPFTGGPGRPLDYLPAMSGSGENEVILYPNGVISIVMAKAAELPPGEPAKSNKGPETIRAVYRLAPF